MIGGLLAAGAYETNCLPPQRPRDRQRLLFLVGVLSEGPRPTSWPLDAISSVACSGLSCKQPRETGQR
jgi:hypothetical protein